MTTAHSINIPLELVVNTNVTSSIQHAKELRVPDYIKSRCIIQYVHFCPQFFQGLK